MFGNRSTKSMDGGEITRMHVILRDWELVRGGKKGDNC